MGKTEKELLDEIVAAAAQRGLSLNNILSWVKKHKLSYRGPNKLKIDIAIAIRDFYEKNKKLSPRQLKIKFAQSAAFTKILDTHYKSKKRTVFDDPTKKTWTEKLVLNDQDLQTLGNYKRYKLIDNQLLRPSLGMGILSIFWTNTVPYKLITIPKK
jgi:hypothetical protein